MYDAALKIETRIFLGWASSKIVDVLIFDTNNSMERLTNGWAGQFNVLKGLFIKIGQHQRKENKLKIKRKNHSHKVKIIF